jgi:hypothetical protein
MTFNMISQHIQTRNYVHLIVFSLNFIKKFLLKVNLNRKLEK